MPAQGQAGPSALFQRGGLLAAVAQDAESARLAVYDGEVRVAVGDVSATLAAGQEASLQRNRLIVPLASAEEPPARPTLPTDLIAPPTRVPTASAATPETEGATPDAPATLPAEWELYTVQANDTLSGIAAEHGLTWQELWEVNRATVPDPQVLLAGQTLRIPPASGD